MFFLLYSVLSNFYFMITGEPKIKADGMRGVIWVRGIAHPLFVNDFYKDHLSTYKKRPIYWLFSSPKKSFQALIYMHRYNRDTVNLLLNDYLREFQNKLRNRLENLHQILASESTSARDKTAATKEQSKIEKALTELADWERDVILPLAQKRLEIDLDDGVKQNYPKFSVALAQIAGLS